jgi:hypothetical protein
MDIVLIITSSMTLIVVGVFMYFYLTNEKKNKVCRIRDLNELKQSVTEIQSAIQTKNLETSTLQNEKFELLVKSVKIAQDQSNSKINSGFEQLQNENLNIQKDVKEKVSEIQLAFKEYSRKVQETLTKYSDENLELKNSTNQIKEQIHKELKNILTEIKAPLDLD